MDTVLQVVKQEWIESRYSRRLIDTKIRDEIFACDPLVEKVAKGVHLLEQFCEGLYYDSKQQRVHQLKQLDLTELVTQVFIGVAYFSEPTLFTSVCSQIAGRLGFDDKKAAITTCSEILAVLSETDVFDITKASPQASIMLVSRMELSAELKQFIENSAYLPPMVVEPLDLTTNYCSGYLSEKSSLILGKGNHHDGDICLDVLNKLNKVRLKLDVDLLKNLEENPTKEFTVEWAMANALEKGKHITEAEAAEIARAAIDQWHQFKQKGHEIYALMINSGNEIYLTNKVDKRGRIYAQGYHVTTQGTSFKKAMLELAHEELVTGI